MLTSSHNYARIAALSVCVLCVIAFMFLVGQQQQQQTTQFHYQNSEAMPHQHAAEKLRTVCIVLSAEMPCEVDSILLFMTRSLGPYRNVLFRVANELSKVEEVLCHPHSQQPHNSELEKTDYLVAHAGVFENLSNFKEGLKRIGLLFPSTHVIQYLGSDELAAKVDAKYYTSFDMTFRNYWSNELNALNNTLKTIHYLPLLSCYPFISLTSFPTIPNMKDNQLIEQMAEAYYERLLPSSKRPNFCFFKGKKRPTLESFPSSFQIDGQSKKLCDIQFTEGFNRGSKPEYSMSQMTTAISLCPSGGSPETFRMWEALDNGAIPIVQNVETMSAIPKGHPIHVLNVSRHDYGKSGELHEIILNFYKNPTEMDAYQKKLYKWWFHWKVELMKTMQRAFHVV